jgi:antitoxin component YwqK of YwqJK toxin-antitoxin module
MRTIVNISFLILTFVINSQVNQLDSLGRKNGAWTKKWEGSRQIQYEGEFISGSPVGQFRYYYPSGEVRSIIEHVNSRAAFVTFYFRNKEVMSEGFYKDKLRDSLWLNYDREGLTLSAEIFKKGKLHGKRVVFYLRNQIERGELKILSETTYKDSLKDGPCCTFFSSERIKEVGQYSLDLKEGVWKSYRIDGTLVSITNFKHGQIHGWVDFYDATGNLEDRTLYQNGERLNEIRTKVVLESLKRQGLDPND